MEQGSGIRALIEFVLKKDGAVQARSEIDSIGRSSQRTADHLGKMNAGLAGAAKSFVGLFAAQRVVSFLNSAVEELELFNRRLKASGQVMESFGISSEKNLPRLKAFLASLSGMTGITDDELLPGFNKLLELTKNVDAAMEGARIAAVRARAGFGDFGSNIEAVSAILAGKAAMGLKQLGVNVKALGGDAVTAAAGIQELTKRTAGLDTATSGASKLTVAWDSLKDSIAELVGPVWNAGKSTLAGVAQFIANLTHNTKVFIEEVGAGIGGIFAGIESMMRGQGFKAGFKVAYDEIGKLDEEYVKLAGFMTDANNVAKSGALETAAAERDKAAAVAKTLEANIRAAKAQVDATKDGTQARLAAELQLEEAKGRLAVQKAKETGENVQAVEDEIAGARLKLNREFDEAEAKRAKEAAEKRQKIKDAELQSEIALLRAKAELLKEGSKERLQADLELLRMEEQAELSATEVTEKQKQSIRETFVARRLAAETKFYDLAKQELVDWLKDIGDKIKEAEDLEQTAADEIRDQHQQALQDRIDTLQEGAKFVRDFEIQAVRDQIYAVAQEQIDAEIVARTKALENTMLTEQGRRDIITASENKIRKIKKDAAKEDVALTKWAEMSKLERVRYVASAVQDINVAVFNNNKNIAIAAAIVDTIAAAVAAFHQFKGWPAGVIPMAVTLAMGYAKVQQIRKQDASKGKGFDDPVNDRAAYQGGRRWAQDAVSNMTRGIDAGWASAMQNPMSLVRGMSGGGGVTNDNRSTYQITLSGRVIRAERDLRELWQDLQDSAILDRARFVR